MAWFISINTWVAGGIGGVNTAKIAPLDAARVFLRVRTAPLSHRGIGS